MNNWGSNNQVQRNIRNKLWYIIINYDTLKYFITLCRSNSIVVLNFIKSLEVFKINIIRISMNLFKFLLKNKDINAKWKYKNYSLPRRRACQVNKTVRMSKQFNGSGCNEDAAIDQSWNRLRRILPRITTNPSPALYNI